MPIFESEMFRNPDVRRSAPPPGVADRVVTTGPPGPKGDPGPPGPAGGFLPYYVAEEVTVEVPASCQAPAVMDVVVDGALVIGGYVVELM